MTTTTTTTRTRRLRRRRRRRRRHSDVSSYWSLCLRRNRLAPVRFRINSSDRGSANNMESVCWRVRQLRGMDNQPTSRKHTSAASSMPHMMEIKRG